MSIKKLENSSDYAMVAEEVKILTNLRLMKVKINWAATLFLIRSKDLIKISAQKTTCSWKPNCWV